MPTIEEIEAQLTGPGGPFETVEATVLGEPMLVFKERPASLRDMLVNSAALGDAHYIVCEDLRISFARHARMAAVIARELREKPLVPLGELHGRYFLNFTAVDEPNVLAHITGALGEHQISIESVLQKGRADERGSVPVIVLTHPAREAHVRAALEAIDALEDVTAPTRLVRIEEEL